jgi:hypothetical protein
VVLTFEEGSAPGRLGARDGLADLLPAAEIIERLRG